MDQNNTPALIKWWVTPKLPINYIWIPPERRPKGFFKLVRVYYRTWIHHPLKRRVAKLYLWLLRHLFSLKVIAITGSSGKTSTKEMLASILALNGETVATHANIDPVFNIPTTIFKCKPTTKYLILEMGVEYKGDMNFYLWLAVPDIAIVTNIFQTHTLFFDDINGVALEKGLLIKNLPSSSLAVLNKENEHTRQMGLHTKARVVWYGQGTPINASRPKLSFKGTKFTLEVNNKRAQVMLPLLGEHFVLNALAAVSAANTLGITLETIKMGLEGFTPPDQRLKVKRLQNGAVVLDDTYNNNPSAAKATFQSVKKLIGKRKFIIVFGDMKELGKDEVERHREIGKILDTLGASYIILVGPLSKYTLESVKITKSALVESADQVMSILKPLITKSSLILLKGARSLKLEQVMGELN